MRNSGPGAGPSRSRSDPTPKNGRNPAFSPLGAEGDVRAGEEIRPVRAAGSEWIVKDRTQGRRGFRRPRDESNPVGGRARLNGRIFSPTGARRHCPGFKGAGRWGAGRQAGSGNSAGGVGALRRAAANSAPPPPPNPPPSRGRAMRGPSFASPVQGRRRKILPHRGRGTASSRRRGPAADAVSDARDGAIGPGTRSMVNPLRHGAKPRRATSPDGGGFAAPELPVILVLCIRKKPP